MNADANAKFFRHWDNLFDEVGIILPKLIFAELAAMGQRSFKDLGDPMTFSDSSPGRRPGPTRHRA